MSVKLYRILRGALILFFALATASVSINTVAATENRPQQMIDVGGYRLNSVYIPAGRNAKLPPIVFIHGASANLFDPLLSFCDKLVGRADLLFIDRPGHGRSERGGPQNAYPDGQADAIAALMRERGISKAIIVSHSFGGAVAASFALNHEDMVQGLLFLSPAVYPWPGGIAWYYSAAKTPVLGRLFSGVVVPTVGLAMINTATKAVFAPNRPPVDYVSASHALLALRPAAFRNNAIDIANLKEWTKRVSPRYKEIKAPTIIITGDRDGIVSPAIHAGRLARDIKGSRLITVHNLGHKSDYVVSDLAIAAIETLGGEKRDLRQAARIAEERTAMDGVHSP